MKANNMRPVAAMAAAAALAALPAVAQGVIVPGRSVASVSLGDSSATVTKVLGSPQAGSTPFNALYIRKHGLGVYYVNRKVLEITVLRGPQATKSGIRVGSTRAALRTKYPQAPCKRKVTGPDTYECTLRGRFRQRATETVFTTKRDKVVSITVRFA